MEEKMIEESPFYMWTITEAWNWLIYVPTLGFVFLVLAALGYCAFVYCAFALGVIRNRL